MSSIQHRAYSQFIVKSLDAERRLITGLATSPTPDRVGDIIEPRGAKFASSLPLLLYHDSTKPVGTTKFAKPTDDGISFEARIPEITEPGALRDRVEEAWQSIKAGLVKGVSIGFRALDDGIELLRSGGVRFTKIEILELSLVAIPANADAVIQTFKAYDLGCPESVSADHLAATGKDDGRITPGVAGTPRVVTTTRRASMKTIPEQIKDFEATRHAKSARMTEIMTASGEKGETLDAPESEEYDGLEADVKSVDQHLVRLRALEVSNREAAKAVTDVSTQQKASSARDPHTAVITLKENRPAGIGFARLALSKVAARLEGSTALDIAKQRWPSDHELHASFTKAVVPAGTTTDPVWMSPAVYPTNLANEFLEYLRPLTIVGRIPGLRRVPFNVRFLSQTSGASANWVGQGAGKPVTSFATAAQTLAYTKIAAIAVITEELAKFSSPSAETLVRDELARAVIERMDIDFIDPAQAAVANVSPASITNGLVALSSAGSSEANIRTDLTNLLSTFVELNIDPTNLVLILPNTLALAAQLMVNSLGQPSFPGISVNGGSLMGIPVVASQYAANASGSGNLVIALNASDIFLADDGQVTVDMSRDASIQMSDAPTINSATGTGASLTSMFQTNSIAIRAERYINWVKGRANSVVYMDDVNWGSVGSPPV